MAGALIVTGEIGPADFAWVDGLRQRHYPSERNHVPAHITVFHALPPSAETELRARLAIIVRRASPKVMIAGLLDLGGGLALRLVSDDLDHIRDDLALDLHGLLGAQDHAGWRPHITIQNKVTPKISRALKATLQTVIEPKPIAISGLGLYRYCNGPWERIAVYPFRN